MIKSFWDSLADRFGRAGRTGLVAGAALIVVLTVVAGFWLTRPDYQVLFAELTPQDTAAMTAELDRQKIPYVLSDQGEALGTILVDKAEVYKTRIKLMGKDIPLHGQVGFELFNTSDFGMTEFAQKINYQRALQGELTRTILSLTEVRDARVLLALPEQGLFKQATSKPKASVTLTLKPDRRLRAEQVTGIQRLVAASVPGIQAQDVTLVDQTGTALTRPSEADGEGLAGAGSYRLDLKRDTEAYLARKAAEVLDRTLGPGQALASVDVTLDMDRVQSHTDEILSAPGKTDGAPAGVLVRERQTTRDGDPPLNGKGEGAVGGSNQSEAEYTVGHRIEQVIGQPGSIRRIQVAVVVNRALSPDQEEQLRTTVAASVGASTDRGDSVVIQPLGAAAVLDGVVPAAPAAPQVQQPDQALAKAAAPAGLSFKPWTIGLAILAAFLLLIGALRLRGAAPRVPEPLSDDQRREALARVRAWIQADGERGV